MIGAKKLHGGHKTFQGGAKFFFALRAKLLPPSDQNPVYAPDLKNTGQMVRRGNWKITRGAKGANCQGGQIGQNAMGGGGHCPFYPIAIVRPCRQPSKAKRCLYGKHINPFSPKNANKTFSAKLISSLEKDGCSVKIL